MDSIIALLFICIGNLFSFIILISIIKNSFYDKELLEKLSTVICQGKIISSELKTFGISEMLFSHEDTKINIAWYSTKTVRNIEINGKIYSQDEKIGNRLLTLAIKRSKNLINEDRQLILKGL